MKRISIFLLTISIGQLLKAQNVGIGTGTPNSNAALEIKASNKGILMPRVSNTAKNAMANVPKGMMLYDTTYSSFYFHDGNKWRLLSEQNTDSLVMDYINNPQETVNISAQANNAYSTLMSGILYDNGGPSGNYSNSSYDVYSIIGSDSTVGFKVIVEQMNIDNQDSLLIFIYDDQPHAIRITGTTTGTYYFPATSSLGLLFYSNATLNAAGFKIRWSQVTATSDALNSAPSFGWFFDTKKLAVRGGLSSSKNWNTDSLGRLSFAWGNRAFAKGINSFSAGENVSASGDYALATGKNSLATGLNSIAMGSTDTASNWGSVAIGKDNLSSGMFSFALGYKCKATGDYSVAMGAGTEARQTGSVAMGNSNVAWGLGSTATGNLTRAIYNNTTAMGQSTLASGLNAVSMGQKTSAEGDNSISMGLNTTTNGYNTFAAGTGTRAVSYSSFVVGAYNNIFSGSSLTSWVATDPLFIIGNGISSNLNNALVVLKNGNTGIGTNSPQTKLHIDAGTDANLADNSGYLVLGNVNSLNVVFDNNEIIARNNGVNAKLTLQNTGGAFEVGGTAAKPGGGSWTATSDARLKQNVMPYSDGLQQLLKINPVYYQYNQLSGNDTTKQYIGVVAQELKEIAPYMVGNFTKDKTEYLNVDNTPMTYMLINAIKEQQKQIEKLEKTVDELKKNILK